MATTASRGDIFTWVGTDRNGRPSQGEITAISSAMAKAQLRRQGIRPKTVKKKSKPLFGSSGKPIKPADIAVFTRQMEMAAGREAVMADEGVEILPGRVIIAPGHGHMTVRRAGGRLATGSHPISSPWPRS